MPFLVGAFSDVVGLRYGMLAAPVLGVIQVALAAFLHRRELRPQALEGIEA